MRNYDEPILRSHRIDPRAPFPLLHQAVRIALYDEYAARSFYTRVLEAFGARPPFVEVSRSQAGRIATLTALCERFGIPRPLDPYPMETSVAPAWLLNCRRAVAGKMANVRLYANLLAQVGEPEIRRVFAQLQAASLEQHLPVLQQALLDAQAHERLHAAKGVAPAQAYVKHGPLSDFLERSLAHLSSQPGPIGMLSPILRHVNPALLAGMTAGGAGVYLLREKLRSARKEK